MEYIDVVQLRMLGEPIGKSEYGRYIMELAEETARRSAHQADGLQLRWIPLPLRLRREIRDIDHQLHVF